MSEIKFIILRISSKKDVILNPNMIVSIQETKDSKAYIVMVNDEKYISESSFDTIINKIDWVKL